ncbi:hypothetical protein [Streptomyces sp. NPDC002324]
MSLSSIRNRTATMVAAMIAAVLVPLAAPAPAQAAQNAAAGTAAWTPQIYPLFSGEKVWRNISSADRDWYLRWCSEASGIACVSVGQGDGMHSVFHLFKCDTRSLSNFIDALAVRNNQTGGAEVHFWGPTYHRYMPANPNVIYTVPDNVTYDFNRLDIC